MLSEPGNMMLRGGDGSSLACATTGTSSATTAAATTSLRIHSSKNIGVESGLPVPSHAEPLRLLPVQDDFEPERLHEDHAVDGPDEKERRHAFQNVGALE